MSKQLDLFDIICQLDDIADVLALRYGYVEEVAEIRRVSDTLKGDVMLTLKESE